MKESEGNKKMNRMKPNFETKLLFKEELEMQRAHNFRLLHKSPEQKPIDVEAEMEIARDEMRQELLVNKRLRMRIEGKRLKEIE